MVDWLLAIGSANGQVKSRHQATGMWQALLEESIIQHGTCMDGDVKKYKRSENTRAED